MIGVLLPVFWDTFVQPAFVFCITAVPAVPVLPMIVVAIGADSSGASGLYGTVSLGRAAYAGPSCGGSVNRCAISRHRNDVALGDLVAGLMAELGGDALNLVSKVSKASALQGPPPGNLLPEQVEEVCLEMLGERGGVKKIRRAAHLAGVSAALA